MTIIIAILLAPLVLLTLCFAIEVFVGLRPLPAPPMLASIDGVRTVVIVPAHNEERVLAPTLERLKTAVAGQATILLVADNCSDDTARIARDLDVDVVERSDQERRGKGFALDFAREHLKADPPDVVLIVDADCSIDANSVASLVSACAARGFPCQATNLQRPSPTASPSVQLSTFAFFIKNVIRQRALKRLSDRAHLLGTGMALPWATFAAAELATSNIVEDLKLGQDLADAGSSPVFVEQAAVWSRAESDSNTISQRRRWEGGFIQNAVRAGPRLLSKGLVKRDIRLIWAGIDLMIPPFALLIVFDVLALLSFGSLAWFISARMWPIFCLLGVLALALFALALAWAKGGAAFVSLRSLVRAPLYVAWKLPMYMGLARRGAPKEWVRTGR